MKNPFQLSIAPNRIYGLDILRASAILFVVLGHGALLLPENLRAWHRYFVFEGVSIFFVLSGFLIGGILIKQFENNKAGFKLLGHFWLRRWFRTLPNYFLILAVLILLHLLFYPEVKLGEFKLYFVFLQNFNWPHPPYFPEAWSLSIEEWFYLIIPLSLVILLKFLKFNTKQAVLSLVLFIIIASLLYRFWRFHSLDIQTKVDWANFFRKQVSTRMDSLMFGVGAAYLKIYQQQLWKLRPKLLFALGLSLFLLNKILFVAELIPFNGLYKTTFSFSLISLATAFLLPYLNSLKSGDGWLYRNLSRISLISYSMYLINLSLVQGFIIRKINWDRIIEDPIISALTQYALFWIITLGLSTLLYKYFEIPSTRIRDSRRLKRLLKKEDLLSPKP